MFKQIYKLLNLDPDSKIAQYLLKGTSVSFLLHVLFVLFSFLISILLPNMIGAADYGKYVYVINWISILVVIGSLGLNPYLVREIATLKFQKKHNKIRSLYFKAGLSAFIFSVFIGLITWAGINYFDIIDPKYRSAFMIGLLCLPFWVLLLINESSLRGAKHVIFAQISEKIGRPVGFLILILVFYWTAVNYIDEVSIMYCQLISIVLMLLYSLYMFISHEKPIFRLSVSGSYQKIIWLSVLNFFILSILFAINSRADILILGSIRSDVEVGVYNVAVKLSDFIKMFLLIVNLVIAPQIAEFYSEKKFDKLQTLLKKSIRITFVLSLIVALILILLAKYILPIYGKEFIAGYTPLLIMCFAQLINVGIGSVGNVLAMTGNEKYSLISLITSLVVNVALNYILIPKYGINGAAIATATSIFIWNIMMWFIIKNKLKINTSII